MIYNEIKIGHPVPPPATKGCTKYPFSDLGIGECFDADDERVYSAASSYAKKHGIKLTTRKLSNGHIRVWRTA